MDLQFKHISGLTADLLRFSRVGLLDGLHEDISTDVLLKIVLGKEVLFKNLNFAKVEGFTCV